MLLSNIPNTALVIPSRERARWLSSRATNTLKYVAHLRPTLYVRNDDTQLAEYRAMADRYGVMLLLQDSSKALGAAQTYDSLINMCVEQGIERLVILDDDLFFRMHDYAPNAPHETKLCNSNDLTELLTHFASITCHEIPAMSLTPLTKRTQPNYIAYCKQLMWTYSFYIPHFAKHPEHRFWQGKEIEARCDLNLSLTLLTEGFITGFLATVLIPDNVNNPGGCSTYRSIDLERQSVDYLKRKYPAFVKTHMMYGWCNDQHVEREAPIISYKKAFNRAAFRLNFDKDPTFLRKSTWRAILKCTLKASKNF